MTVKHGSVLIYIHSITMLSKCFEINSSIQMFKIMHIHLQVQERV